ncbi:unnamed protein product [Plutella xylostella]|uniref:(diamondback moth) hypothetical protein n=1 Tax=Plutella xylostella TaxID=51655 RepID=A0A8S4EQY1_PLUXY|nr:unnamed protein product [Plutella xylostella]
MNSEDFKNLLEDFRLKIGKDMVEKMQESENRILLNINEKLDAKICQLTEEMEHLKNINEENEKRLDILEKHSRQKNLILFGMKEKEKSYEELEILVKDTIRNTLNIDCDKNEIDFVRRIGKLTHDRPRPILFGLNTLGKKIKIIKSKKKLEDIGAYITEDYPRKILEKRKSLQSQLQDEINKGNKARIVYDRLVVTNKSNKRSLSQSPETKEGDKLPNLNTRQAPKKSKQQPETSNRQTITSYLKGKKDAA